MLVRIVVLAVTLLVALLPPSPVAAGTEKQPEILDTVGDANAVNGQGQAAGEPLAAGPDGRPASIDGADLRAIWFETTWSDVVERDGAGAPLAIRRVVDGLRVRIATTGAQKPTFGPTVVYRVPVNIDGCEFNVELWLRGTASAGRPERADLQLLREACPGYTEVQLVTAGVSFALNSTVATITVRFASLPEVTQPLFGAGKVLTPFTSRARAHTRPEWAMPTAPAIDEAPVARPFTIGSDVPADIDCRTSPAPQCAR